ncbi:MAG: hypothetical protein ACKVVT_02815 [Dehalococcoidia bacterium]
MVVVVEPSFQTGKGCDTFVGEVVVEIFLENAFDAYRARAGEIAPADVRREAVSALIEIGTTELYLGEDLVARLGLPYFESLSAEYANRRRERLPVAGPVALQLLGQTRNFDCVVGPPGARALVGQVVLEKLDLLVDCAGHHLVYRTDPAGPVYRL